MSFLSGIVNFGKSALGFLGGNSIGSSLVKTALLGFAVNKMSKSVLKENDTKGSGGTSNIDKGVRLQVKPNAEAKIPVLYGDAFFGGNISDAAMTNANKTMWYCLTLAEKTGTKLSNSGATSYTFHDVYWNQQRIVFQADGITADYAVDSNGTIDRSISGLVKVYLYAGSSSNGIIPSGYSGSVPNADTVFPNWASGTHPMTNLVFALVRVDYNREKNVTGIADMLFQVESDMKQPGDVLYDYLTSTVYGAGIPTVEIDTTSVSALNTYSAESVSYNDEGTGAQTLPDRYQINGLVDTDETVLRNAEQICSSTASWLSYDTHEGKWGVVINKAGTSAASFSDTNILGNISVGGTGLQDLYNSVKVEFPHRDLRDSADFIKIEIPANLRNANEPDNTLNITYDNINEPVQAEQLGFIELKQSRVDLVIQFDTDFSYINLKAGDVIDVTNDRYSFTNKLFRIVTVTERQDNDGALMIEITALEYDADVYSVSNITRFTRSSANGIISIGAIGVPTTPQVTKYERASRPRIEIEVNTPSGVVEGLEYWVSFDYTETDDTLRSYTLVGTKKPLGGGVFTSSTQVVFEYANLNAQNFYVKVRGFNTTAVGPYSNVSGLVEFIPEQVPDAITPDTSILDSTGGLATALGIVSLLNNIDGLFGSSPNQSGGLFSKIFDVFNDETGIDLVGDAASGNLVVAANIDVKEEGSTVASQISSLNFVGDGLTVTATGTDVTVTGGGGTGTGLPTGTGDKDIVAWNAEAGEWQIIPNCISCDFPETPEDPPADVPCSLTASSTLPGNIGTSSTGVCKTDNAIPYRGSYFISFSTNAGSTAGVANPAIPQYAPLEAGIGTIYLYGSDGVLEQALTESQLIIRNNVIELPFAPRLPGKDYYITLEEGVITSCSCENTEYTWSFRTSIDDEPTYNSLNPASLLGLEDGQADGAKLTVTSFTPTGNGQCPTVDVSVTFSEPVVKGSGSITFKNRLTGASDSNLSVASATLSGATLTWTGVSFTPNTKLDVEVPSGFVNTSRQDVLNTVCGITVTTKAPANTTNEPGAFGFGIDKTLEFARQEYCPAVSGNSELISNIALHFNKAITANAATDCFVNIYEGGQIHQRIDITDTFELDGVLGLSTISGSTLTLNPTKPFKPGKSYTVQIPTATLKDSCNVVFGGVTTQAFETDGIEQVIPDAPTYSSVFIDLEFKRPVVPGYGKINIVDNTGKLLTQLAPNDKVIKYSKEPF